MRLSDRWLLIREKQAVQLALALVASNTPAERKRALHSASNFLTDCLREVPDCYAELRRLRRERREKEAIEVDRRVESLLHDTAQRLRHERPGG